MSRERPRLSAVIDEVVSAARAANRRHAEETQAIKTAEAMPRTEIGRGFRELANQVRSMSDDITYADLMGAP